MRDDPTSCKQSLADPPEVRCSGRGSRWFPSPPARLVFPRRPSPRCRGTRVEPAGPAYSAAADSPGGKMDEMGLVITMATWQTVKRRRASVGCLDISFKTCSFSNRDLNQTPVGVKFQEISLRKRSQDRPLSANWWTSLNHIWTSLSSHIL